MSWQRGVAPSVARILLTISYTLMRITNILASYLTQVSEHITVSESWEDRDS